MRTFFDLTDERFAVFEDFTGDLIDGDAYSAMLEAAFDATGRMSFELLRCDDFGGIAVLHAIQKIVLEDEEEGIARPESAPPSGSRPARNRPGGVRALLRRPLGRRGVRHGRVRRLRRARGRIDRDVPVILLVLVALAAGSARAGTSARAGRHARRAPAGQERLMDEKLSVLNEARRSSGGVPGLSSRRCAATTSRSSRSRSRRWRRSRRGARDLEMRQQAIDR